MEKQEQDSMPLLRKILLKSLKDELRPEYRRRIEIILRAEMGQSQAEICEALGCSQETARYWIGMTQAGQAYSWNDHPIGRPKTINEQYLDRLKQLVSHSPRDYGYPFRQWTAQWLKKHLGRELGIEVSDRHINRLLKQMGLSTRQERSRRAEQATHIASNKPACITITDLSPSSSSEFVPPFNLIEINN